MPPVVCFFSKSMFLILRPQIISSQFENRQSRKALMPHAAFLIVSGLILSHKMAAKK